MGCVGVGWRRRCTTRLSLRELDNQGTVLLLLFFTITTVDGLVIDHFCAGRTSILRKGDARIMQCVYGKAPTSQLHSEPIAVSGSGHTRK